MSDTQDDLTALIAELKDAQASDVTLDLTIGNNGTLQRAIEALERAHFQKQAEPVGKVVAAVDSPNDVAMIQWTAKYRPKEGDLIYTSPPIQPGMVMVQRELLSAFVTEEGPDQNELNRLRELLAAPPIPADQWQPIETFNGEAAPKVGKVLVCTEDWDIRSETAQYVRHHLWAAKTDGDDPYFRYWMPLPAAPANKEGA